MRRRKKTELKEDLMVNLIAMVDIMFLLLLFFMLGADMGQRELAELVLPQADQIKEDPKKMEGEVITTINIHHKYEEGGFTCPINARGGVCREPDHWFYAIRGKEYTAETLKPQLLDEANELLEDDVNPEAGKRLSKRKVLIRGDMAAPYGMVNKLIEICGSVGLYKLEVGGAQPPKE